MKPHRTRRPSSALSLLALLFAVLALVGCEDKKETNEGADEAPTAEEATAACQETPEASADMEGCKACCTGDQKRPGFMYDGMQKTCTCE